MEEHYRKRYRLIDFAQRDTALEGSCHRGWILRVVTQHEDGILQAGLEGCDLREYRIAEQVGIRLAAAVQRRKSWKTIIQHSLWLGYRLPAELWRRARGEPRVEQIIDLPLDRLQQQRKILDPVWLYDAAVVHLLEKTFEEGDGRAVYETWAACYVAELVARFHVAELLPGSVLAVAACCL